MTIKNPCVDPSFVNIVAPTLSPLTYTIDSGSEVFNAHPVFTVDTTGVVGHGLCGGFTTVTKYDNESLPLTDDDPLAYNDDSRVFTADTTNINLINQDPLKTYSVEV